MLDRIAAEAKWFSRSWWCRGHGAAVVIVALLAVVLFFRDRDMVFFWMAIGFFVGHTATAARRYTIERRVRSRALLLEHHATAPAGFSRCPRMSFLPPPLDSVIPLEWAKMHPRIVEQQTLNHL